MECNLNNNYKVPPNAILNLNDDCLLHIFSYLSFYEKFRMSGLCKRFENIFGMSLKRVLNINEFTNNPHKLTLIDAQNVFDKYGNFIEHILFIYDCKSKNWQRFVAGYVPSRCPNLKTLKLRDLKDISLTKLLLTNLKSLSINKLELINCKIDDAMCLCLLQLPELNSLNLSGNEKLTGKNLNKFEKLQSLALGYCYKIKCSFMAEFCTSLKLLKELAVDVKNRDILNLIVKNMKNLEKLKITAESTHHVHIDQIAKIENLKSLSLVLYGFHKNLNLTHVMKDLAIKNKLETFCLYASEGYLNTATLRLIPTLKSIKKIIIDLEKIDNEFLENCAKCHSLQYLCIRDCTECRTTDIINFIRKAKSLQTLHFDVPIPSFNKALILGIIDLLNQGDNRSQPLKLILEMDEMEKINLENLVPNNLSKMLKISSDFEELDFDDFI